MSQSELYHKVELDALYQNLLKIRSQETCSPRKYEFETFPEEWPSGSGSERAKVNCNHKVDLDALYHNMLNIRSQGTCSPENMGLKPARRSGRAGVEASEPK